MSIVRQLVQPLARLQIGFWLRTSSESWKKRPVADDSPHVHAPGIYSDRVLLIGDGVASGRGVLTHDLGLAGYLARGLSALSGHATDVDIVVDQEMTVESLVDAIDTLNLARFDTIVVSVGHNEALSLMTVKRWRAGMTRLLDDLQSRSPAATPINFLAIPAFGPKTALPDRLARIVDRHARVLNTVTMALIENRPNVSLIGSSATQFEPETTHLYKRWADHVAVYVDATMGHGREPAGDTAGVDEMSRQLAIEELEVSSSRDDSMQDLIASARSLFGTPVAAITLVRSDYLTFRAASGLDPIPAPRTGTFCDVTIRHASHLVVEDTRADPRYADFPDVTGQRGIRFYAGYPIESPEGHRVGAFCVMDTETRRFSHDDLRMLRELAHLAQDRLWPAG